MPPTRESMARRPSSAKEELDESNKKDETEKAQHDDGAVGRMLYLAAGAALMWLGTTMYDALNPPEEARQSERPYRERSVARRHQERAKGSLAGNGDGDADSDGLSSASRSSVANHARDMAPSNAEGDTPGSSSIPSFFCPITHEVSLLFLLSASVSLCRVRVAWEYPLVCYVRHDAQDDAYVRDSSGFSARIRCHRVLSYRC